MLTGLGRYMVWYYKYYCMTTVWTPEHYTPCDFSNLIQHFGFSFSSEKAFHKIMEPGCRDLFPVSHQSINEVSHRCWVIRPGLQLAFQFIPKLLDGVEVRALLCVKSSRPSRNQFVYGPGFVHRSYWKKGPSTKSQSLKLTAFWNLTVCCSIKIPLPNHEK